MHTDRHQNDRRNAILRILRGSPVRRQSDLVSLLKRDGFDVTREHAKGDCALRGAASDLLLVLWRRRPMSTIDVVGDADVAARFLAWPALT